MKPVFLLFFLLSLAACGQKTTQSPANTKALQLVQAARSQIGVTTSYDGSYVALDYPGGDIPLKRGVCTDVVIRALRKMGADLQKLVHVDMRANFPKYPKRWGLKRPDKNIDHRRVPNLQTFMKRRGLSLPVTKTASDYRAGDFMTCLVSGNLPHIVIVSDKKNDRGEPLIIHNIGSGTVEESGLFTYEITGHYRWFKN